jgi:hypothetical protein
VADEIRPAGLSSGGALSGASAAPGRAFARPPDRAKIALEVRGGGSLGFKRMADVSADWNECKLVSAQPAHRGLILSVPLSEVPGARWSRQFQANAINSRHEPPDRTWRSQPKLHRDVIVVEGVSDENAVEALRRHLDGLVQLTNGQRAQG